MQNIEVELTGIDDTSHGSLTSMQEVIILDKHKNLRTIMDTFVMF